MILKKASHQTHKNVRATLMDVNTTFIYIYINKDILED